MDVILVGRPKLFEHLRHFLMDDIYAFQWPDHYFEVRDLSFVIPGNDVDAVHQDAVDLDFEFKHYIALADDLPDIPEGIVEKYMICGGQIKCRDLLSGLRRVYDGRMQNDVIRQQAADARCVMALDDLVPAFYEFASLAHIS